MVVYRARQTAEQKAAKNRQAAAYYAKHQAEIRVKDALRRAKKPKGFNAYIVRIIATDRVCYVGATTRAVAERWQELKRQTQTASLRAAIREYGYEAFEVVHVASAWDTASLSALEAILIAQYNTLEPNGYNSTTGGQQRFAMSLLTRARMSAAKKGIAPLAAIEARRAAGYGRKLI